jgi:ribonuclease HI
MLVTIIADASVDPEHRVGGFGCWIVSARGRHAGEGAFKNAVQSSHVAEMMAIVNSLSLALSKAIAFPGDQFLVQTDSINAIAFLKRRPTRKAPAAKALHIIEAYERFVADNHVTVEFRHVKAHTNGTDPRFKAQRHSDIRARRAMREARAALLQSKQEDT